MKIKSLLFIIIPLLFVFNGMISLLLFNSTHQVNESYANLQKRLLIYETINHSASQGIQLANQWMSSGTVEEQTALQAHLQSLKQQELQLKQFAAPHNAEAEAESFLQLITSYYLLIDDISKTSFANSYELTATIDRAELISSFITEESYKLINFQLAAYENRYEDILKEIGYLRSAGIALLASSTLLCLWLAYSLSKSITTPIHELVRSAKVIAQGNFNQPITSSAKQGDFYILGSAFSYMQNKLKHYIAAEKETLEKDKQLKEMELEVLKSQINPHFLFNSLNVMSKLALIEGAERTSDLTVAISNLLRYSLKRLDTPVPLRDEVKHARDYFYIQQARYRDRVQFNTDIDEHQLDSTVPVLTLQPILENIFVHGIESLEHGAIIKLLIHGDEQYTWITITDNGIGMSESTRQALLQYSESPNSPSTVSSGEESTGLGTRNVFRRLELLYGSEHYIDIKSSPGQGTSVTLRIPRHKEE